jgi:hypothetical protein
LTFCGLSCKKDRPFRRIIRGKSKLSADHTAERQNAYTGEFEAILNIV